MGGYIGSKASVTLVDGYTQSEADAEFVAKAGDTMTGDLDVDGTITATSFSGDGSALTGVGASTTVGAVGTYAFLQHTTANLKFAEGVTYAGSDLRYSGTLSSSGTTNNGHYMHEGISAASGTWRAMGAAPNYFSTKYPSTLFLRIS